MQIYDISREVFQSKVYPGDPKPEYERVKEMSKGDACNLSMVRACSHNATHVDAPFHFYHNGKTIEELELQKCVGKCAVIQRSGKITEDDIKTVLEDTVLRKILIKGEIEITVKAAQAMAEQNIELLGVEGFTVGTEDTSGAVHRVLLGKEIVIVESLNLTEVSPGIYFLFAAPVKYGNLDGAPCRALLISCEE